MSMMNGVDMTVITGLKLEKNIGKNNEGYTYSGRNGKSIIDHIGIDSRFFELINKKWVNNDSWDTIRTKHYEVGCSLSWDWWEDIDGEMKVYKERRKRIEKRKRRSIRINKITEEKVWKKYKDHCKNLEVDSVIEDIEKGEDIDESWN